ncbi:hypothetical protein [Magnetospirillum sp. UT-4]|uniref:phosphoribosyltransferase-like protein n=1 Tax=Magnetospirillum sp. UT-4 TaxID=2681467 RepID=UPI0013865980|nr:hypothetical protein [Magnetospirillum sp. UT-4]CAA7625289.1 conserved hypothetical protein [Magnetospirillum sp. UT-4]
MPIDRNAVAAEIAVTIADYRQGEIAPPNREHVLRWIDQFDAATRDGILVETQNLLARSYIPKPFVEKFINMLANTEKLVGPDPRVFWSGVGFLNMQRRSQSQRDMLALLSAVLTTRYGLGCEREKSLNGSYVYIDDAIFSGNQVRGDVQQWIEQTDARNCHIHVIVIGWHKRGQWYANKQLRAICSPRSIRMTWWKLGEIEDWKKPETNASVAVLWPTHAPNDQYIQNWFRLSPRDLEFFTPRPALQPPLQNSNFTSEAGRVLLEQAFMQRGAFIASLPRNHDPHMHPLGYQSLNGPGFGTLFATYRNCPNNCPLVLWWGDPDAGRPLNQWYPLLPRRTRAQNWAADFDEVDF